MHERYIILWCQYTCLFYVFFWCLLWFKDIELPKGCKSERGQHHCWAWNMKRGTVLNSDPVWYAFWSDTGYCMICFLSMVRNEHANTMRAKRLFVFSRFLFDETQKCEIHHLLPGEQAYPQFQGEHKRHACETYLWNSVSGCHAFATHCLLCRLSMTFCFTFYACLCCQVASRQDSYNSPSQEVVPPLSSMICYTQVWSTLGPCSARSLELLQPTTVEYFVGKHMMAMIYACACAQCFGERHSDQAFCCFGAPDAYTEVQWRSCRLRIKPENHIQSICIVFGKGSKVRVKEWSRDLCVGKSSEVKQVDSLFASYLDTAPWHLPVVMVSVWGCGWFHSVFLSGKCVELEICFIKLID